MNKEIESFHLLRRASPSLRAFRGFQTFFTSKIDFLCFHAEGFDELYVDLSRSLWLIYALVPSRFLHHFLLISFCIESEKKFFGESFFVFWSLLFHFWFYFFRLGLRLVREQLRGGGGRHTRREMCGVVQ